MKKISIVLSFVMIVGFFCVGCSVENIKAPKVEMFGISFTFTTSPVKKFLDEGYVLYYENQEVDASEKVEKLMDLGTFVLSNGEKEATVTLVNLKKKSVRLEQCSISMISLDLENSNDDFKIKGVAFSQGMNKDSVMTALEASGVKRGTEISEGTDMDIEQTMEESSSENENTDEIEGMLDFDVPEINMVRYSVLKAEYDFGEERTMASCRVHIDEETDTIVKIKLEQIYVHDMTGARD